MKKKQNHNLRKGKRHMYIRKSPRTANHTSFVIAVTNQANSKGIVECFLQYRSTSKEGAHMALIEEEETLITTTVLSAVCKGNWILNSGATCHLCQQYPI